MKPLRLAIINLTGGGISGGHKKYLQNMLPRLVENPGISSVLCASPESVGAQDWLPIIPEISYVNCEPFLPFRHKPDAVLRKALDVFRPDLLFIPVERYINYNGLPVVTMLQNMAPLAGAKTGFGIKEVFMALARNYEARVALRKSAAIIVPTKYVENVVLREGLAPKGKIVPIHYGNNVVSASAARPTIVPNGRFILTAGSLEAYRGLEDLIQALPQIQAKVPGIKVVVAGGARSATIGYLENLKTLAKNLGIAKDIFWLGNVSEAELSWWYSNCAVFALTSRMESFCFVALEALAHGCVVVSTESACLPEILGEAATYYKAGAPLSLAAAILAAICMDDHTRASRVVAATSRANSFSWDDAATATLAVFEKALHAA